MIREIKDVATEKNDSCVWTSQKGKYAKKSKML